MKLELAELMLDLSKGLLVYGPLGVFCLYFMYRDDKRDKLIRETSTGTNAELRGLSHRISGLSKALIMDVLSRESVGEQTKRIAEEMLTKLGNGQEHQ